MNSIIDNQADTRLSLLIYREQMVSDWNDDPFNDYAYEKINEIDKLLEDENT